MDKLDSRTTALVLIDLQKGILGMPVAPHSSQQVVDKAVQLLERFRALRAPVVLVHVGWSADMGDALKQPVDEPMAAPPGGLPPDWMEFSPALGQTASDIVITKRQWGAFTGTELDLQLRRRGVRTIVLAGIATNIGVESTARAAWELGYALVFAEDATASRSAEMHRFAVETIFPRLGLVRHTSEIAAALG